MAVEKVLLNYRRETTYVNTDINTIGATTSALRTTPTPTGDIAYVRKFGKELSVTACTDIDEPTANGIIKVYSKSTDTLLGSRANGGAFIAGSSVSPAEGVYLVLEASGGNFTTAATEGAVLTGHGAITMCFATETLADGETRTLYLSEAGSTYYDTDMKYGGARHTPVLDDSELPYFHPYDAYAALNSSNDGVEILDSETYSFPYRDSGGTWRDQLAMDTASTFLYSTSGQTPTIMGVVGASIYREQFAHHDNTDTLFVAKTGNDANPGTYQEPFLTHAAAFAALAGETYIVGMDTETYNESFTVNAAITFESLYGVTPTITNDSVVASIFNVTNNTFNVYGYIFSQATFATNAIVAAVNPINFIIRNNSFIDSSLTGSINYPSAANAQVNSTIKYNYFEDISGFIIFWRNEVAGGTGEISHNVSVRSGTIKYEDGGGSSSLTINNNVLYDGVSRGIEIDNNASLTGDINNNIVYNTSTVGIYINDANNYTGNLRNNIVKSSGTWDLQDNIGSQVVTHTHYETNSGMDVSAGTNKTTDFDLSKETSIYKLGLAPSISADTTYRTDSNSDDRGAHFRLIEIDNDNCYINGIIFDGNNQYNNAIYIADTADHTGHTILFNTIQKFQGVAVDLYDNDADISATVNNNNFNNNGTDLAMYYGGNTVEENLFYRAAAYGIWSNYTGTIINHNTFYNSKYNTYLESNSGSIIYKNNISSGASISGLTSEVSLTVTYTCIADGVNANVDNSGATNITLDPLFINTTIGSENFHLKTEEEGYVKNSPCKEISDSTPPIDIGAWNTLRSVTDQAWRKYQLEYNPENLDLQSIVNKFVKWNDIFGNMFNYSNAHRRVLPFKWGNRSMSSETQYKKIEYFSTLIPSRQNGLLDADCEFRVHLLPTTYIDSGTSATVSATGKTLTDSAKSWVENELKGWWVGIKFDSGTGGTLAQATSTNWTLTISPDEGWTNDEWIGYYFYYNGYYYYILDNQSSTLELSDPDSTLSAATSVSWNIEKYFKIEKNEATIMTLTDDNSELVAGTYDWYVDFMLCKIQRSRFKYKQPGYDFTKQHWKTGYDITFEEVD